MEVTGRIKRVGADAFKGCGQLKDIDGDPKRVWMLQDELHGVVRPNPLVIPARIKTVTSKYVVQYDRFDSVEICKGVKEIESEAFYGQRFLKRVHISGSVKYIGEDSFGNCPVLSEVIIEDGVEHIGEEAFENCPALKEIAIPGSVKTIPRHLFRGCHLNRVVLRDGVKRIENDSLENVEWVEIPQSVKEIETFGIAMGATIVVNDYNREMINAAQRLRLRVLLRKDGVDTEINDYSDLWDEDWSMIDPKRLERAHGLSVRQLDDNRFLVSGGRDDHIVTRMPQDIKCDCSDYRKGTCNCKHVLRVRLMKEDLDDFALAAKEPFFTEDGPSTNYFRWHETDVDVTTTRSTYARVATKASDSRQKRKSTTRNENVSRAGAEERSIQPEIRSEAEGESVDAASLTEYLEMAEKIEKAVYVAETAYKTAKSGCVERKVTPRKIEKRDVSKELIKPQAPVMEEYIPIPVPEERKIGPLQRGCCIVYIFSIMFLVILIGAFWYALLSTSSVRMIAAYGFFTIGYCVFVLWLEYRRDRIKSFEKVNKEIPIIIQTNKENEEIYQKAYNDNQAKYKKALEQYELDFTRLDIQAQEEYEQACVKRDKDYQRECEIAQENYRLVKNEVDWLERSFDRVEKTKKRLYSLDSLPMEYRQRKEKADKSISGCKEVKEILSGLSKNISSIIKSKTLVLSNQAYEEGKEVAIASDSKLTPIIKYVLEIEEEVNSYISSHKKQGKQ